MLVGKQFGPFKVEKELGSGAMGSVYRGVDETTGRRVAIKIIAPGLANNETAVERFLRESKVLKRLSHPNIARYLGSGRYRGTPFYIMEFIQGESLDHVLARRIKITWEELVAIGTQLCAALQAAHDAGIIHRDLKPSNLMMLPDGRVKLTDFGIAKDTDAAGLTATHSTLGTAAYMSPEQCRGAKDITYKSDLYSMGIMFYELVTGKKPFTSENPMEVFMLHVKGKCARPSTFAMDLPIWLDTLICQLMEKAPDDRPLNATKVAEELDSIARKVTEQASAGLDRVAKRRADVTTHDVRLDATDKEIARTLLGKKKKPRKQAKSTQNMFTAIAVVALLIGILTVIYVALFKTPSADGLYQQTAALMKSEKLDDHKDARDPIDTFLRYHSGHALAEPMKRWRDQIELESTQFFVRREVKGDADPKDAWDALDDEKSGRLDDARKRWLNILPLKGSSDREKHGWGLYAEKALADLAQVNALEAELYARIRREIDFKDKALEKGDADRFALNAMRSEDPRLANRSWEDLKRLTENAADRRKYYL
ncbi:MAG: serine/threonine-protein kinase, partial [Planctomycetota bacterium]